MLLSNNFSLETTWPIFNKFQVSPTIDPALLTVMPIYGKKMIINSSSSKPRTAQMVIFSLVAMTGLEKCCPLEEIFAEHPYVIYMYGNLGLGGNIFLYKLSLNAFNFAF